MKAEKEELSTEEMKAIYDGCSVDWYLQHFVSMVNESDFEIGITLTVGGSVVSGQLVGRKKYFETFAKEFSNSWPGDSTVKESIRSSFAKFAENPAKPDEDVEVPPPQFIHLIKARFFYPGGQLPNNQGVLWRGKINAVSGFNLGAFSAEHNA